MVAMMGSLATQKGWRKGPWTGEEDKLLGEYVSLHGEGRWSSVSKFSELEFGNVKNKEKSENYGVEYMHKGLNRNGKSCRLRWVNYLRPGLKKCQLTPMEEEMIIELHAILGSKWSTIAKYLPGRTDNEIKNYWRTHFGKRERCKHKKLQRPKLKRVLKHFKQKQQQPQDCDMIITFTSTENDTQNNYKQQEMDFMYPTTEHQYNVPSVHEGFSSTRQDTIGDGDLWFSSLWDFDEAQGFSDYVITSLANACAMPNHDTFGVGGEYYSMQNHVKTSCFDDTFDNLFYGKDIFG